MIYLSCKAEGVKAQKLYALNYNAILINQII